MTHGSRSHSLLGTLLGEFEEAYGHVAERVFFCPGRVNLIGEHLDYNGGHVLPAAIDRGVFAATGRRTDGMIELRSLDAAGSMAFPLREIPLPQASGSWLNYPLGVFSELYGVLREISGHDILYSTSLPQGAGLSSSAALEIVTGLFIFDAAGTEVTTELRQNLALKCQQAEHHYAGVKCGIMDQFAVSLSKAEHALMLNTASLSWQYIPAQMPGWTFVVMHTGKSRPLTDSSYHERQQECSEILRTLQSCRSVRYLAEAKLDDLSFLSDPVLRKRLRHVVEEERRVVEAAELLRSGQPKRLGRLLSESHRSLDRDYEVSGSELNTMVNVAARSSFCSGARMTGAGFGGCALALVDATGVSEFIEKTSEAYFRELGLHPDIFSVELVDGGNLLHAWSETARDHTDASC